MTSQHTASQNAAAMLLTQISTGGPATLSVDEVQVLTSLLEQFAADQVTILSMQRRLDRLEQSADRTDRFLVAGVGLLNSRLSRPDPTGSYDFAAARKARQDLADAIARSGEPADVWSAAIDTLLKLIAIL